MKNIIGLSLTLLLASCGSDEAAKLAGAGATLNSTFTDSTITAFEQTSNVASNSKFNIQNIFMPSAVAATGNISCVTGTNVDFSITGLQSTIIDVTAPCSNADAIDFKIRGKLLETLKNKKIFKEVSEQGKDTTIVTMPATAAG